MGKSILDKVNEDNWRELAAQVAQEIYPVGSLVDWHWGGAEFGLIKSISSLGRITVQRGKLSLVKITDSNPVYGKFWYNSNLKLFVPYKKSDFKSYERDRPTTCFNPFCYNGNDWGSNKCTQSPIMWTQSRASRMVILGKPEINKKGLIMEESYSD